MEAAINVETHRRCKVCGMMTRGTGHLCDPLETAGPFICEYCGASACSPRHVCKSKLKKLSYVCDSCGRVAISSEELCKPTEIKK